MGVVDHHRVVATLLALALLLASVDGLDRRSFPAGFLFGTASSAYQYEGEAFRNGKGASIWDTFTRFHPEKIKDHSNGNKAIEFYDKYKEDIALMKDIGLDSFRFSISWSRILPQGRTSGGVNQEGVRFYNNLINELLSNGIQPFVTLFHWDLPQALEDEYLGFLSPKILRDYQDYVNFCFKEFGDRVKHWVTFNEPSLFSNGGYATGAKAPGRCSNYIGNCSAGNSATEPYVVTHHMLLCHANAVKLYRDKYKASQKGQIGITLHSFWVVPKYETVASRKAALTALDFGFGWFAHPITYGDYPATMRSLVDSRLPNFTEAQSKLVKGSIDFFGVNYYSARYADESSISTSTSFNLSYTTDSHVNLTTERDGIPIGQPTTSSWLYVYPKGIHDLVLYIKTRYNNPTMFISENGFNDPNNSSIPVNDALDDSSRIDFHFHHLSYLSKAIEAVADVRGYYVWSFLDDFEWEEGFTLRFGITYVDFENGFKRFPKRSAFWFRSFLQKGNVTTGIATTSNSTVSYFPFR